MEVNHNSIRLSWHLSLIQRLPQSIDNVHTQFYLSVLYDSKFFYEKSSSRYLEVFDILRSRSRRVTLFVNSFFLFSGECQGSNSGFCACFTT